MESTIDIILIVLPIVVVGAIALFVINRLKAKQNRGTLGKKETTEAQTLLDSLIPLGMIFGSGCGVLIGVLFTSSLSMAIPLGAGFGMLVGYFAYEFYSEAARSHS